jgi:hypothetical protein
MLYDVDLQVKISSPPSFNIFPFCSLPAFEFFIDATSKSDNNIITNLSHQMEALFSQPQHAEVAQCIAGYGMALNNNNPSLKWGICRLCQHFHNLCQGEFADSSYVFAVIVDQIRTDNVEERTGVARDALTKIHVDNLTAELKKKVPLTYLHIPNSFEFRVGGEQVEFTYWQSE